MHPKLAIKKQREATEALTAQVVEMNKTLTEVWKALDTLDQKVDTLVKKLTRSKEQKGGRVH